MDPMVNMVVVNSWVETKSPHNPVARSFKMKFITPRMQSKANPAQIMFTTVLTQQARLRRDALL
jgi:hypothetical protein